MSLVGKKYEVLVDGEWKRPHVVTCEQSLSDSNYLDTITFGVTRKDCYESMVTPDGLPLKEISQPFLNITREVFDDRLVMTFYYNKKKLDDAENLKV